MNSTKDALLSMLKARGALSVHEFMEFCLTDPIFGYYQKKPVLGQKGDFVTSPEISQMFGELIGLWLAQCWIEQGRPSKFTLLELGPGRGTLLNDVLRATKKVTGFHEAMQILLFEASKRLNEIQQIKLQKFNVEWQEDLRSLPLQPLFFIANEFFDALPIRQFQRKGDIWFERQIKIEDDKLIFSYSRQPAMVPQYISQRYDLVDGDIVEFCPYGLEYCELLSKNIEAQGGIGIIIDYGDWLSRGDTLQATKDHTAVDIFKAPGDSDLTAHVDFAALASSTCNAMSVLTKQGIFLERIGITERAKALSSFLEGEALKIHIAAHKRLTHPDEMGNHFKVMAIYPSSVKRPTGF